MASADLRGHIQTQIQKLNGSLDTVTQEQLGSPDTLDTLNAQLEYLAAQKVDFFNIHNNIAATIQTRTQHQKEEGILNTFIDVCDTIDIKLRKMIRKSKAMINPNSNNELISLVDRMLADQNQSLTRIMSSHEKQMSELGERFSADTNTKLPLSQLKIFSGKYQEWPEFYDFFSGTIHTRKDIKAYQKFQYLRMSLTGDATKIISHLTTTESNYNIAWELLVKRYHKPRSIVSEHMDRFFGQKEFKTTDVVKLRERHDLFEECYRAGESLGAIAKDAWLVHFAVSTLDPDTRELWYRERTAGQLPKWQEFSDFYAKRCDDLEAYNRNSQKSTTDNSKAAPKKSNTNNKAQKQSTFVNTNNETCKICGVSAHQPWRCDKLRSLSPQQKLETLRRHKICTNCLSPSHERCEKGSCKVCQQTHNTMLHDAFRGSVQPAQPSAQLPATPVAQAAQTTPSQTSFATMGVCAIDETPSSSLLTRIAQSMLLPTVQVYARGSNGRMIQCRALLDSCSQVNLVTHNLLNKLKLPKRLQGTHQVSGINNVSTKISHTAEINIASTDYQFNMQSSFSIIDKIVDQLPSDYVELSWKIPEHIKLADPQYMTPGRIDLLLGADFDAKSRRAGRMQDNSPVLLETAFGWVIQGAWNQQQTELRSFFTFADTSGLDSLNKELPKFWEIEECQDESAPLSMEELECEKHFAATTTRDSEGRYTVSLPTRHNVTELGDSKFIAERRFKQLEKKLQSNPQLKSHYVDFMRQYKELGHMRVLPKNYTSPRPEYYLPHHAVVKMSSSSTPVRVVFDASCKTSSSLSLNSVLKVGPRIQEDLFNILVRFRQYNYVIMGDVEKMFRQVKMHEDDQNLQRIFWRESPDDPLETFLLGTVTYGTASASYLSIRATQQLVKDDGDKYPHAKKVAIRDFYVDDLLSGAQTIDDAITLQAELTALFKGGGFPLKKWTSNSQVILDQIPIEDREAKAILNFNTEDTIKTLGLQWHPATDVFTFEIAFTPGAYTKRTVLSNMSRIFDPLGLLSPMTITAKIFMQTLWSQKVEWDTDLPENLRDFWISYENDINNLSSLTIQRKFTNFEDLKHFQLYGFCDASERAYAACIYARTISHNGEINCQLIAAKTRVSPLASLTIPRLELCGAITLVRLIKKIQQSITLEIDDIRAFTDSTIVLHWINGESRRWKTFVRNRVAKIQAILPAPSWNHVRSEQNPADLASRGVNAEDLLTSQFWWNGPEWICDDISPYIDQEIDTSSIPQEITEALPFCCLAIEDQPDPLWSIIKRYSRLWRLIRAVAILTRYSQYITNQFKPPCTVKRGAITYDELKRAKFLLIKAVQAECFSDEIHSLAKHNRVKRSSKLNHLYPFLDEHGIIRVGGRIENAVTTYDHKHPIVLPKNHHFTKLVADDFHLTTKHGGENHLLNTMRLEYWPIHGPDLAKQSVKRCIRCFKVRPKGIEQLMAHCPDFRVQRVKVFDSTGIDFCGPFYLKPWTRKGASPKVYVCVFICLTTRFIHLEVVEDLSTAAFLDALHRFTARRGTPTDIRCDNATNFVGASRELERLEQLFLSEQHQNDVINDTAPRGINFKFIPPASPTFGGSWEAAVKLFKTHLKRVTANALLTFGQFITVVVEIEAALNSRPLTPLSGDPNDFTALTPAHFVGIEGLTAIPEPRLAHLPPNRLGKLQICQYLLEHFWNRWHKEYLHTLQSRNKWQNVQPSIQVNDLVLLKDDRLPPLKWVMGRVIQIHPGKDCLARKVTLRVPNGITERALSKICPLPKMPEEEILESAIPPGQDVNS